jgi:general secretion pathway protein K
MAKRNTQRGAALLLVLTAVAILTAVGVDLAYNTRVSLQIAANARDELRATYLAKSAVNLSRLVIHFQQQLDQTTGALAGLQGGTSAGPQLAFRLWEVVPIDSSSTAMFLGGGARGEEAPAQPARPDGGSPEGPLAEAGPSRAFGDYEGAFQAKIEDEDRKIDVSQLAALPGSGLPGAQWLRLSQLIKDQKYDFLFDRDDEYGNRFSRNDVVINLKDWVDEDEVTSSLTGNPLMPFAQAFGDENFPYDKGSDRYKAKNERFDSLDELFMVGGIGDAFMAAFGDKLTVYLDKNATINVNTTDPQQMLVNILVMAQPPGVVPVAALDPTFFQKLEAAMALARPLPFMSLSVQQFAQILTALGIPIQQIYLQAPGAATANAFGNRSSTFHIRAAGTAGQVTKTIDAVVTVDSRAGVLAADLGRVLHWREE